MDLLDTFGDDDVRPQIGARSSETPFSSERKWMGVIISNALNEVTNGYGGGPETAYIKGALEKVIGRCATYLKKDGRDCILE